VLVLVLVSVALLMCILDAGLTYVMVKRGVVEVNAVIRSLFAKLGLSKALALSRVMMVPLLAFALWWDNLVLATIAVAAPSIAVLYYLSKRHASLARQFRNEK